MWLPLALGSAIFAGLVSVLGKRGLAGVSANLGTAIRSLVALIMAWLIVAVSGSISSLQTLSLQALLFLLLSGVATGASWLLYFRALQLGRVAQVVSVDRTSLLVTGLIAMVFFGESNNLVLKICGLTAVLIGTLVLIVPDRKTKSGFAWFLPAFGSMFFAVATTILAKFGLAAVDSTLATAIRTIVVVIFAFGILWHRGEIDSVKKLSRTNLWFLLLSGLATGASWLCFFGALKLGQVSQVLPVDKLSILFAAAFAYLFLGEKIRLREGIGLTLAVFGTLLLIW
jgi:transporter family protein